MLVTAAVFLVQYVWPNRLHHWEAWELGAIAWTGSFAIYYHFTSPEVGRRFDKVMSFVCIGGIFLGAVLSAGCLAYWIFGSKRSDDAKWLLYLHIWIAAGISACLSISDLLYYRYYGDDQREKQAFLQSAVFADLPATAAFAVLIAFGLLNRGAGETLDVFFGGAISLQFLAANVVFVLIQADAETRADTDLRLITHAAWFVAILILLAPVGLLASLGRLSLAPPFIRPPGPTPKKVPDAAAWLDLPHWQKAPGTPQKVFGDTEVENTVNGLLAGALSAGPDRTRITAPSIDTVFFVPGRDAVDLNCPKIAVKLQRIAGSFHQGSDLFAAARTTFAGGATDTYLFTRSSSVPHVDAYHLPGATWVRVDTIKDALIVCRYCEKDFPEDDYIQVHVPKYLDSTPNGERNVAHVEVGIESERKIGQGHVWLMRSAETPDSARSVPIRFQEQSCSSSTRQDAAGTKPLEEWIGILKGWIATDATGLDAPEIHPIGKSVPQATARKHMVTFLKSVTQAVDSIRGHQSLHCVVPEAQDAVVFTYALEH